MSLTVPVLVLAAALPTPRPPQAPTDEWVPLDLPSICVEGPVAAQAPPIADGLHVRLPAEGPARGDDGPVTPLSPSLLLQMLDETARPFGLDVDLFRAGPPYLVRGEPAAVDAVRSVVAEFDEAGRALEVEVVVSLLPEASDAPVPPTSDKLVTEGARLRSGDTVMLGERRVRTFVGDYLVEVAADSGAASPVLGTISTGETLHLTAFRVDGGRRVHMRGLLDLAELESLGSFDPMSADLGPFQQPTVDGVQVSFAGTVDNGGTLRIAIRGSDLASPDWTVWVTATTRPDTRPAEPVGWAVNDLAFLANRTPSLPQVRPEAGLDALVGPRELAPTVEPLPPSAVAVAVESRLEPGRSRASRLADGPAPSLTTPTLLLVPYADEDTLKETRALVGAVEAQRLSGGTLSVQSGSFSVELPITHGVPVRILSSRERTLVVDYDLEIATETWMPVPDVRTSRDGLCVDALAGPKGVGISAWFAKSGTPDSIRASHAHMGEVQLSDRTYRVERSATLAAGDERWILEGAGGTPGVHVRYTGR